MSYMFKGCIKFKGPQDLSVDAGPGRSALAERLWSNPDVNWKEHFMDVEIRMVNHRQLLVERGVKADAIQPQYCYLNEGSCEILSE